MFGCFTKPIGCLDIVLFNAFTILIAHSQFGLGVRISLFRRFTEPFERFLLVGHPEPKVLLKGNTEPKLRLGHTLLGGAPHAALVFEGVLISMVQAYPIFRTSVTLFR